MKLMRLFLVTGMVAPIAFFHFADPAMAGDRVAPSLDRPLILAQTETDERVLAAIQVVDEAQKALRAAREGDGNVGQARRRLAEAMRELEIARAAVDKANTGKASTDKASTDKASTDKASADKASTDETAPASARSGRPSRDTAEPASPPPAPPPVVAEEQAASPVVPEEAQVVRREGDRVIVRTDDNQVTIIHDDTRRLRRPGEQVQEKVDSEGTRTSSVQRPDGTEVVTEMDREGRMLRRYRRDSGGRETVLIDNRPRAGTRDRRGSERSGFGIDFHVELPPLVLRIPRQEYIVESRRASRRQIEDTLRAPPLERLNRGYTLDEIRYNERVRNIVRRIDIDDITFQFGSAELSYDEIDKLEEIGRALKTIIDRNDRQTFLIEGHADWPGSEYVNLALSDRRAETVANILRDYFFILPENLITQGYGNYHLKIPTQLPERQNRRVTIRNITLLLAGGN